MQLEARATPPDLFDPAKFELGPHWFAAVTAAALPEGASPLYLTAVTDGRPRVALPLLRRADGGLAGLTTPYTTVFRPLVAPDAAPEELHHAGRLFARFTRAAGPLRLDALAADWPGLPPLLAGFAVAGMLPVRFAHFGNWHLDVAGQDWAAYLAARPGELRSTIRRKLARAEKELRFEIVTGGTALDPGIAAYAAVYARSWKEPEPYPSFAAAFMRAAAAAGALRLGLLHARGEPIAAQIWLVSGGTATVHKLAHDERHQALSPGTVLTALMIRHLLDREHVAALDFGRGDDPYKAGWTGARRQRIGVLLCPPWHPGGLAALARHAAKGAVARLARVRPAWRRAPAAGG